LGFTAPPVIMAYRGYGTTSQVYVRGHVLNDRVLYEAQLNDRRRKNLKAMLSRYMSRGIPLVRVGISFAGQYQELQTDQDGYFETVFEFETPLQQTGWQPVLYKVLDQLIEGQEELIQSGEIYVLEAEHAYGVISDIDDTILISHSGSVFRKLELLLWKNAKTRLPFTGVTSFYQALQNGTETEHRNPIFYVSSSEWNLYDFLEDFFRVRELPKGPFLLKDLKSGLFELFKSGGGKHHHKLEKIKHLLTVFPDLKFILIGDSSQKDAAIYTEVAQQFPNRILALYIRSVSDREKVEIVLKLANDLKTKVQHLDLLLINDTAAAAKHAYEHGFIDKQEYEKVKQEVEELEG